MLMLTRIPGEKIVIDDGEIVIEITEVRGEQVKLGITAPSHVSIDREEIHVKKQLDPACQLSKTPIPDQRYFTVSEAAALAGIKLKELMVWQSKFPETAPRRQLRELIVEKNYNDDQIKQMVSEFNSEMEYAQVSNG